MECLSILLKYNRKEEKAFTQIIKNNMNLLLDVYNNQDLSFAELSNNLKLMNINNLFIFQPYSNDLFSDKQSSKSLFTDYKCNYNNTDFDLTFSVFENNNDYLLSIDFKDSVYSSDIMQSLLDSFMEVLSHIDQFNHTFNTIEYTPSYDKEKVLKEFNNNEFKYEFNKFYHVEFSKIVKENPSKTAVICNGIKLSYEELDKMSNSLAYYLRNEMKIGRNEIIPIISERSFFYVIAVIATMKCGAAFLPIDPEFPKNRIEYMIRESHAKYILKYITNKENDNKIRFDGIINYSLELHNYNNNTSYIENINEYNDLCYVIFTSGTTGKPKGTMITHNNLINYCLYGQSMNGNEIFCNEYEIILSLIKFTFDVSIAEIFYSLLKNKTVVICDDNEYNDPELIGENIIKYNIDGMFITPSRFSIYLENETYRQAIKQINCLMLAGENLNAKYFEDKIDLIHGKIFNGYGPTEATITCTLSNITKTYQNNNCNLGNITIGKPICNGKIYILDEALNPVPIGVEGEIYIGGYGVGKGYLNHEELTKEKFIECPFSTSDDQHDKIMYKSGDLGKWTPEDEIICLGRIDFQVKIHGQRIEWTVLLVIVDSLKDF